MWSGWAHVWQTVVRSSQFCWNIHFRPIVDSKTVVFITQRSIQTQSRPLIAPRCYIHLGWHLFQANCFNNSLANNMSSVWRVSSSWSFIGLTSTSVTSQVGTLARYVLMSPTDLFRITLQDALGRVVLFRRTLTSIRALTWFNNMYTHVSKQITKTKQPVKQILIIATAGCWPAWPLVVRDPIKILVPSPFPSSASASPPSVTQSGSWNFEATITN